MAVPQQALCVSGGHRALLVTRTWPLRGHPADLINFTAEDAIMTLDTGAAVSKQRITELKDRLLALKEHL